LIECTAYLQRSEECTKCT